VLDSLGRKVRVRPEVSARRRVGCVEGHLKHMDKGEKGGIRCYRG
jgi:hypothetical protein